MIDQKVKELMCILLHVIVEFLLLLAQTRYKLLRRNRTDLLLLRGNAIEEISKAREQRLLGPLVLGLVLEDLLAEWLAEVEGLQHRVTVAGIPEVDQPEVVLVRWKQIGADLTLQLRDVGAHGSYRGCRGTAVQKTPHCASLVSIVTNSIWVSMGGLSLSITFMLSEI